MNTYKFYICVGKSDMLYCADNDLYANFAYYRREVDKFVNKYKLVDLDDIKDNTIHNLHISQMLCYLWVIDYQQKYAHLKVVSTDGLTFVNIV